MRSDGNTETQVREAAEAVAARHSLFVERVEVALRGKRRLVIVTLDLADGPGSLGSDLLADASREISAKLDELDIVQGVYTLEVTSPGATRPLVTPRHYRRAARRLVKLTLTDGSTLLGRVVSADDDGVRLLPEEKAPSGKAPQSSTQQEEQVVGYERITAGVVEIELRRLEED